MISYPASTGLVVTETEFDGRGTSPTVVSFLKLATAQQGVAELPRGNAGTRIRPCREKRLRQGKILFARVSRGSSAFQGPIMGHGHLLEGQRELGRLFRGNRAVSGVLECWRP